MCLKHFRGECIFTIDPATARDLDDAVSIANHGDGTFSVGVHIADVSFFIPEDSELDRVASRRANSFYLVQKVGISVLSNTQLMIPRNLFHATFIIFHYFCR